MLIRNLLAPLTLGFAAVVEAKAFPVTGVVVDPRAGGVPLRQNINDLQAIGGPQWDLYIRALRAMYDANYTNDASFFQVAGIHGKPYIEWNTAGSKTADGWQGYCPHGENIFVSWHRAYVLLFEQILVTHAKRLAKQYPQRVRYDYIQAAENLRAPYWDYATNPTVPPATVPATLKVKVPDGSTVKEIDVQNPLATYAFPQAVLDGKYGTFDSQKRAQIAHCPAPDAYPDGANSRLAKRPYKRLVYEAFTHSKTFAEFASTGAGGASLEQIHNGVHWDGACGSQLVQADFSAFDPLFMLHHTNIDRWWAYWQATRPDEAIFNSSYPGGSRFSSKRGTSITVTSPLQPFYKSPGVFHTSDSVKSIQGLGYSYLGLEYWSKTAEQMSQDTKRMINRLYSPTGATSAFRLASRPKKTTKYYANIELDVTQVERPCEVNLYIDGQQVGNFVVMQQPEVGTVSGGFVLDDVTQSKSLKGLSTDDTVDSMQKSLQVEIVKKDGTQIDLNSVPSLKIELEDVPVTPPTKEDEFPQFGPARKRRARPSKRKGPSRSRD